MSNTLTHTARGVESNGLNGFVARVRKSMADYRLYRRTLAELRGLNDRELQDLGLSRFVVNQIAYESVYGA